MEIKDDGVINNETGHGSYITCELPLDKKLTIRTGSRLTLSY